MVTPSRLVLPATCSLHGCAGFTNWLITPMAAGRIRFDPHVDGSCVLTVRHPDIRTLIEHLGSWL